MAKTNLKCVESKYFGVSGRINSTDNSIWWYIHLKQIGRNSFKTERDAAIAVDKILISKGKNPVNILKKA